MEATYQTRGTEFVVGETLKKCAAMVEPTGKGSWDFILSNGSALLVSARADEGWLHLDAPLDGGALGAGAWRLLSLNRRLGGLAKLALPTGRRDAHLRAEITLDEEVDVARRLREACAGFKAVSGVLHGEKLTTEATRYAKIETTATAAASDEAASDEAEKASELRRLCEETGWRFNEKSATKLAVELEARGVFHQVAVERRTGGVVSLSVELAGEEFFSEAFKRAAGELLLRASAAIKLVRASVDEGEGRASAGFEVVFPSAPCAAEFGHALAALAVACGLCGREAAAMRDERVAERYLSMRARFGLKEKGV